MRGEGEEGGVGGRGGEEEEGKYAGSMLATRSFEVLTDRTARHLTGPCESIEHDDVIESTEFSGNERETAASDFLPILSVQMIFTDNRYSHTNKHTYTHTLTQIDRQNCERKANGFIRWFMRQPTDTIEM